jgi:hypothetical protein
VSSTVNFGWVPNADPAVELPGLVLNTIFEVAAGFTVKADELAAEVTPLIPLGVAVNV